MLETELELVPRPTDECLQGMITLEAFAKILEEAGCDLQTGLSIGLESPDMVKQKIANGKAAEVWAAFVWRDKDGKARLDQKRGDLKFCRAVVAENRARGHPQLIMQEEPGSTSAVVGHIIAETFNGIVVVRWNAGIDGERFWEILPSSLSKGELAGEEAEPIAIIYANHQRLGSLARLGAGMAVYEKKLPQLPEIKQDDPDWEDKDFSKEDRPLGFKTHMSIYEFFRHTDDCRSGLALLKVLLGRSDENIRKVIDLMG